VPLFEPSRAITVDIRRRADVALGDIVLVKGGPGARGRGPAEVICALGRPNLARDVVEALLVERGYCRHFDPRVENEAAAAAASDDREHRRDLTALATYTIDPASARDFDDALSVEGEGDSQTLYVHIADVAAHVASGSATDAEALRRGNSVYVPGAVSPMLPETLSNDACSLVPRVPRKAVTVELTVGQTGPIATPSFYRSLICSDARFTYEEVEQIFAGRTRPPEQIAAPLARSRALAARLRRSRLARGALGLETSEPKFEFDSDGHVVKAIDEVQSESHGLVEELMIVANESVAATLERGRRPALYRVHEQPEPSAVQFLAAQLESLDVPTPPIPDHLTPQTAGELAGAIGASVMKHVQRTGRGRSPLTSLVLRSLKQAYYSPSNLGHAGLASSSYCHFTSPIRRYPDLVVHRSLLAAFAGGTDAPAAHELDAIAAHCSLTEREAMSVEHEGDDICLAFLAEHRLRERGWKGDFEGEVNGVISAGAFVSFHLDEGTAACEGFMAARRLPGDFFGVNELGTALIGRRTRRALRLGDRVTVRVEGVDPPRGRIELAPARDTFEERGRGSGGPQRSQRAGAGRRGSR
jgi:ribonuclease R